MRNYYLSLCLFLLSFPLYVEAQSPGGVDGAELWHMTVPMNTDLTGNYFWRDYAGDTVRSRILDKQSGRYGKEFKPVSYTHLTLPTIRHRCRSRWSPYH